MNRLIRLCVGLLFVVAGAGKQLAGSMVVNQFSMWGVPYPEIMPTIVGVVEFFGGISLIVGRFYRFASLILFVVMIGATVTHAVNGEYLAVPFTLAIAALLLKISARHGVASAIR